MKKNISIGFLTLIATIFITNLNSCKPEDPEPKIVEEGLFINEVFSAGDDWVELYNDNNQAKDIGGYNIYDDATLKYKIPSGTTISAKGFLIINCNDLATGLNTNFKLSSTGETVYLENTHGVLVDKVEFPALDNGQSFARFPDGSASIAITGNTTKGATNGDSQAPAVAKTQRTPLVPSLTEAVTVQAELVSNSNISTVTLFYRLNSAAFTAVSMSLSGTMYQATIPAANATGTLSYYVEVKGTNNKISYSPSEAPASTHSYLLNTDELPQLVINEFMAFNTSCCPDTDSGLNEFDDWIEIYNKGTTEVNLAGMFLSDSKGNPFMDKISSSNATKTTIKPGEYLVFWADNSTAQGPLHLNFGLANAGEDIALFYIDGRMIDSYTFGAQNENVSFGRVSDGASTWKAFSTPTPGNKNE